MKHYEVLYLDNKDGTTLMTADVDAEDEGEALDIAMEEDYYFGKLIEINEV